MTALAQPIHFVANADIRTAYRRAGTGPLLLMVHGAEADHTMFLGLMDALAKSFSVVAYDQRDSGQTENSSADYDIEDLADDAAQLINVLLKSAGGRSVHVFGTSFGGLIAQVLAARHPQLVGSLILGSTWPVHRRLNEVNPDALRQLAQLREQLPGAAAQMGAFFFSPGFLAARPETVELFRGSKRSGTQAARRALMMQAPPPSIDFSAISAPTLLLAGSADVLVPPTETFGIARLIARAHKQELLGLPHVGAIEDPERVAEAIERFLLQA
ncbi:alpha/beta fold hydrolase [Xenophilus aerolatus]|nr:alpha/beta hydrolase [Xenophilus aerolatus]